MEIGKLNQRIDILENITEIDKIGNHKTTWKKIYSVWASVTKRNSTETTEAGVTKEVQELNFSVRQNTSTMKICTPTHRIQFQGLIYDIKGIYPDFIAKDYLKITCDARKSGA